MFVVVVNVRVKPHCIEDFKAATKANSESSLKEPGIARFDVLQDADDATHFLLVEAYRTPEDPAAHKETAHYKAWRDTVEDMMAEKRTSVKCANVFPDDLGWG